MSIITKKLDAIFEEESINFNPVEACIDIVRKLDAAKQQILDLQNRLTSLKRGMVSDVALGVRKENPALNVGVDDKGCKFGYQSNQIQLSPDIEKCEWIMTANDTSESAPIDGNIISKILDHFNKLFGEDFVGKGMLFLEGRQANQLDIVSWKNHKPLMSRKYRRSI